MDLIEKIKEAKVFLEEKGITSPEVGVVLGTGLNELIQYINVEASIAYSDIPHFPVSTVEFHKGKLIYGTLGSK